MHYYFLNPVAPPETDFVSAGLVFLGMIFLIAAIVSVIFFALKQANDRYEKKAQQLNENLDDNNKDEN